MDSQPQSQVEENLQHSQIGSLSLREKVGVRVGFEAGHKFDGLS